MAHWSETAPRLRCYATWLDDEPQPGWVLYEFTDAAGETVRGEDKPIWTDEDIPTTGERVEAWFAIPPEEFDDSVDPPVVMLGCLPPERSSFPVRREDLRIS